MGGGGSWEEKVNLQLLFVFSCFFRVFFQLIECSIFAFTNFGVFGLSRLTSEGIHDLYM